MDTAIKKEEDKIEYFDTEEELEIKVEQLAMWIRESVHFTCFTGAGVSTGAGISDFRSGVNTCLDVGPGVWEKKAHGIKDFKPKVSVPMLKAYPTKCHMALVKLVEEGILKHIISQNVDGLHRKSGIDAIHISELHGNTNLEKCSKCGKDYFRDFRTRTANKVKEHDTGRKCDDSRCRGNLRDSIINFGEQLPENELTMGFYHAGVSDLMLCLGSSLRVNPAAMMPDETVKNGGRIVIVNLQKTPLDEVASMLIHSKIEDVMTKLMQKLNLEIPKWQIIRRIKVSYFSKEAIKIKPVDEKGSEYSFIKTLKLNKKEIKDPYKIETSALGKEFQMDLEFHGYYDEPNVKLTIPSENISNLIYILTYDPYERKWTDILKMEDLDN
jgi:NAD-dependent SIR2 family protein deacetylase